MMMMPERKKAVTVIIAGMGNEGMSGPEDDYDYALKECAMKIMKAMEQRDVSEFCEYMKEFISMCKQDNPKPEMEMDY